MDRKQIATEFIGFIDKLQEDFVTILTDDGNLDAELQQTITLSIAEAKVKMLQQIKECTDKELEFVVMTMDENKKLIALLPRLLSRNVSDEDTKEFARITVELTNKYTAFQLENM